MTDAAISVEDVGLVYGEGAAAVRALDGATLTARRGELLVLMGPSGSGKTTLLMVMGCLLHPDAGTVRVLGQPVNGMGVSALARLRLQRFGFVFQNYNLFPALTAGENVRLALDLKGVRGRAADTEAMRLLAQVGLAERAQAYPAQLSGGQKQRVAIARALAGDPDVILADEPTAALDWTNGRAVVLLLRELARTHGRAVVVVSHDPRVAELADRVAAMEDGRVMQTERTDHALA